MPRKSQSPTGGSQFPQGDKPSYTGTVSIFSSKAITLGKTSSPWLSAFLCKLLMAYPENGPPIIAYPEMEDHFYRAQLVQLTKNEYTLGFRLAFRVGFVILLIGA